MMIDTHVHLDDERYNDDIETVLASARESGVGRCIIPGAHPRHLPRARDLCEQFEDLYFAVGVHPYDYELYDESLLNRYINHPKCVAVGECGLDYFRLPDCEKEAEIIKKGQEEVFRLHIQLAKKVKKPLIVHIRDASLDAKMLLLQEGASEVGGVLHCFNADEQLLSLANEGFYFGIGGVLTFSNARKLIHVLPKIPEEKLLLETDAPYLTPHPHRGKRNEPSFIRLVAEKMGEVLGKDSEEVIALTTKNAKQVFFK